MELQEIGLHAVRTQKRQNEKEGEKRASKFLMDFQALCDDFRHFVISLYLEVFNLFGFFVIIFNPLVLTSLEFPFFTLKFSLT